MKNKQLKKQLKALKRAAASQPVPVPPPPLVVMPITVREWMPSYVQILLDRKYCPQTLRNRRANQKHILRIWGDKPLATMRPYDLASGLRQFTPEQASQTGRVLSELRDLYVEAIANGHADLNPAVQLKAPRHKVKRKRLTLELFQRMLEMAKEHKQKWVHPLLLLAAVTGQRRADLAKMKFTDIVEGHLQVEQQKQAGKGYGACVEIPLSLRLDALGTSVHDVVTRCQNSARAGDTLIRQRNGSAVECSSLSTRFKELIRRAAGSGAYARYAWPSLHEVRSLSARLYTKQGVDVQTLLGHKNPEMTAVYTDDRGLAAGTWKRVTSPHLPTPRKWIQLENQNAQPIQTTRHNARQGNA